MTSQPAAPTLRSMTPSVYLPTVLYEMGNGAIAPVIALTALHVGASAVEAGFILAVLGVGQVLGDVPAASLAEAIGDRLSMMVAAAVAMVGLAICLLSQSIVVLGAGLLVLGIANSSYYLARQAYMADVVPLEMRARAMSTLGGSHRVGLFVGPFVGAATIHAFGLRAPFVVAMLTAMAASLTLLVVRDIEATHGHERASRGTVGTFEMLSRQRRVFATIGVAILAVCAVRAARQTVLRFGLRISGSAPRARASSSASPAPSTSRCSTPPDRSWTASVAWPSLSRRCSSSGRR